MNTLIRTTVAILTASIACTLLTGCPGAALTGLRGAGLAAASRGAAVGTLGRAGAASALAAGTRAAAFGEAGVLRAGSTALARAEAAGASATRYPIMTRSGQRLGSVEVRGSEAVLTDASGTRIATTQRVGSRSTHYDANGNRIGYSEHGANGRRIDHYEFDSSGSSVHRGYDLAYDTEIRHFTASNEFIGATSFSESSAGGPAIALGLAGAAAATTDDGDAAPQTSPPPQEYRPQPQAPSRYAPSSPPVRSYPLHPHGVPLNVRAQNRPLVAWSDGAVDLSANGSRHHRVIPPGHRLRFQYGGTIHARPASRDATTLYIQYLE